MCVCLHTHAYTWICVHTYVRMCVCTQICAHVCIHRLDAYLYQTIYIRIRIHPLHTQHANCDRCLTTHTRCSPGLPGNPIGPCAPGVPCQQHALECSPDKQEGRITMSGMVRHTGGKGGRARVLQRYAGQEYMQHPVQSLDG